MSEPTAKKRKTHPKESITYSELVAKCIHTDTYVDFSVKLNDCPCLEISTRDHEKLFCPTYFLLTCPGSSWMDGIYNGGVLALDESKDVINVILNVMGRLYLKIQKVFSGCKHVKTLMEGEQKALLFGMDIVATSLRQEVFGLLAKNQGQDTFNDIVTSLKHRPSDTSTKFWYSKLSKFYLSNTFHCPDLPYEFWERFAQVTKNRGNNNKDIKVRGEFIKAMSNHTIHFDSLDLKKGKSEFVYHHTPFSVDLRDSTNTKLLDHLPDVLTDMVLNYLFGVMQLELNRSDMTHVCIINEYEFMVTNLICSYAITWGHQGLDLAPLCIFESLPPPYQLSVRRDPDTLEIHKRSDPTTPSLCFSSDTVYLLEVNPKTKQIYKRDIRIDPGFGKHHSFDWNGETGVLAMTSDTGKLQISKVPRRNEETFTGPFDVGTLNLVAGQDRVIAMDFSWDKRLITVLYSQNDKMCLSVVTVG